MNVFWQKSDCKNSKNRLTLSKNQLISPYLQILCFDIVQEIQVVLVSLPCLLLIKFLLAMEWVVHLFFDCLFDQGSHHHRHPLPLERALKAVDRALRALINEDHTYQSLVFHLLVPSLLYYLPYQLDLL